MRKAIGLATSLPADDATWIDLESASVEVTSEDAQHPIEAALLGPTAGAGWRAGAPGPQRIRLTFDEPRNIRRISFEVVEDTTARTQEVVISCSDAFGQSRQVAVQQWTFSPQGSTRELEDYRVELNDIKALDVVILADLQNPQTIASLRRLRVG